MPLCRRAAAVALTAIARATPKPFWKRSSGRAASYPARGVSTRNDLGRSDFWPAADCSLHDAFAPGARIYRQCRCGLRGHYAPASAICSLARFLDPSSFAAIRSESTPGDHQHVVGRSGIGEPRHEFTRHDDGVFAQSAALRSNRTRTDRLQAASGLSPRRLRDLHARVMWDLGCSGTDRIAKVCCSGRCRYRTPAVWCSCGSGVRAFVATGSSTDQKPTKFVA